MNDSEIDEMAIETARLYTREVIEATIRKIMGECKSEIEVSEAMEKPSYQILRQALRIRRQATAEANGMAR